MIHKCKTIKPFEIAKQNLFNKYSFKSVNSYPKLFMSLFYFKYSFADEIYS